MKPIVQISLDLTNIDEALTTAAMALRAGVDWPLPWVVSVISKVASVRVSRTETFVVDVVA